MSTTDETCRTPASARGGSRSSHDGIVLRMTKPPKHPYWGELESNSLGVTPRRRFKLPGLGSVAVLLGEECVEDEPSPLPATKVLDGYAKTFGAFVADAERHLATVAEVAFKRYVRVYARYYEDAKARKPLGLTTAEAHRKHLGEVQRVQVTHKGTVRLVFRYSLDTEHGLELKFVNGQFKAIGGIAET